MVEKRTCSFCGGAIEPGTGKMFVRRDGTVLFFCSNKCEKNMVGLKRLPRRVKWVQSKKAGKKDKGGKKGGKGSKEKGSGTTDKGGKKGGKRKAKGGGKGGK